MVRQYSIAPKDAWELDFSEIQHLIDKPEDKQDLSFMLNYERVQNGAPKSYLAPYRG